MAVVDKQKVDLLYKKLFGVSKTDFSTLKGASNEVIPSPALIRGDTVWTQSNSIIKAPAAPAAVANIVEYRTVQCIADTTTTPIGGVYPTWIAKTTGGSAVEYKNWIPPEFGPGYLIEVFIGNPSSGGTKIFDAGINDKGAYYFDYMSGVLNFTNYLDNGNNSNVIPDGLSGNSIWIRGYRYIGFVGISDQQEGKFGNLQLINNTIKAINKEVDEDPLTGDVILRPQFVDGVARVQGSQFSQHLYTSGADEYNTGYVKTSLLATRETLNGTWAELTLDGLAPAGVTPGATNRFFLENNYTYKIRAEITGKLIGGTDSAIWNLQFLAQRGANASTTSIIGNTLTEKVAGSAATSVTILTVNAGNFVNDNLYKIKTLGDTDWASIAQNNAMDFEVGTVFTAKGAGSGTGQAYLYLNPQQSLNLSWSVKAEADSNGLIKIMVKGPDKADPGDANKNIKWFAAINILEIYQT
jgi:hypothetical protein